ncbi:DUF3418 domain-containing protein [Klebsiella pneumoniae]|nr:DUF3418 domain-containing protein [Klebsiella pneumoniae]
MSRYWGRAQGAVMATEKVTVFGLPIIRRVRSTTARSTRRCAATFIRNALVEGDWQTRHAAFRDNLSCARKSKSWSISRAVASITVDDETLFEFYDQRISPISRSAHFDRVVEAGQPRNARLAQF